MRRFHLRSGWAVTAAFLLATAWATPAGATGYWNVPSTFCQCMGCGWGAGYHAPLVLGPISCQGWCAHNEVRLPYSPTGSCACYTDGGHGCDVGQPSRLEPMAPFAPQPTAPALAPSGAIFDPPIER